MSAHSAPVFAPLPRSHYFFTVSRGTGMRTFAVRIAVVYLVVGLIPLLGLIGTAATAYVLFHDEVVASLMARQGQLQFAYEDRLDALRGEMQRQTVQQTTERTTVENTLRDLLARESKLEGRASLVSSLADLTGATVPVPGAADLSNPLARTQPASPSPLPDALGVMPASTPLPIRASVPKPRPEADPAPTAQRRSDTLSAIEQIGLPLQTRLLLASAALDKIEQVQLGTLLRIGSAAREEASRLAATLDEVGLSVDRFHSEAPKGQGGPFVPLPADRGMPFGDALANLQDSLTSVARLRDAVARVPLADPLPGVPEVTSPFGARLDPFLGRPALHTGVDLRENFGTEVKATAGGRVVSAGPAGGYGNMVEINHGDGLVTRYAHLQDILVTVGQTVDRDDVVGQVGSTGRATGPHLHYEVRIDGEPVDPVKFLDVGLHLAQAQAQTH